MKKKIFTASVLFAAAFLMFALINSSVAAEKKVVQSKEKSFVLDGVKYSKNQIIEDFLKIAFSTEELKGAVNEYGKIFPERTVWLNKTKSDLEKVLPWIVEYVFREKGVPKSERLGKFHKPITIGFGWPPNGMNPRATQSQKPDATKYYEIKEQVIQLRSSIKEITGLNVEIIEPKNETLLTHGAIRIIPSDIFSVNNRFKASKELPHYTWTPRYFEQYLRSAIHFTPNSRSQVDGYIVPESDNSIGMSFCKIDPSLKPPLFNALVAECLIRSLGFPEMNQKNKTAYLGHWNEVNDKISKVEKLDGKAAMRDPFAAARKLLLSGASKKEYYAASKKARNDKGETPAQPLINTNGLSQYDKIMLKILYCMELKTGMSKNEVKKKLTSSDACF